MNWTHFLPVIGGPIAIQEALYDYHDDEIAAWQLSGIVGGSVFIHLWEMHHLIKISSLTPHTTNYLLARGMMTKKALWEKALVPSFKFATAPGTAAAIALAVPTVIGYQANKAVIESAPEEEQRGLWQMFSSGLTGTFGIGSGLNL